MGTEFQSGDGGGDVCRRAPTGFMRLSCAFTNNYAGKFYVYCTKILKKPNSLIRKAHHWVQHVQLDTHVGRWGRLPRAAVQVVTSDFIPDLCSRERRAQGRTGLNSEDSKDTWGQARAVHRNYREGLQE